MLWQPHFFLFGDPRNPSSFTSQWNREKKNRKRVMSSH
uniref:Uncharacterized protein n=1 Tax=Rhizophora mucronata TaxID=61149 RepID=A0A2P2P9X1_RHIMU